MVAHVSDVLLKVVDDVVVVTSEALDLDRVGFDGRVRMAVDREPSRGPLAGIRDGLAAMRGERAFVTGTDVPYLSPDFVSALFAFDGAVAPEIDGYVQPLAAVYPAAAKPVADTLIAADRMRPLFLLEAMAYRKVAAASLPGVDSVRGFNTPEAYLEALAADGQGGEATVRLQGALARVAGRSMYPVSPGHLGDALVAARIDTAGMRAVMLNDLPVDPAGGLAVPLGPGDYVVLS